MSEYARLRDEGRVRPKAGPSPTSAARQAELNRRRAEARRRATVVIRSRHPDEWLDVYRAERAAVDEERGPIPG